MGFQTMNNAIREERNRRAGGYRLAGVGWGLFALSMTLPAVHIMSWAYGWECFRMVFQGFWEYLTGEAGAVLYYSSFALTNAAMLLSPLLVRRWRHDRRNLRRFSRVMAAITAYTATLPFFIEGGPSTLGIGFYVWLLSFGLVAAGTAVLSRPLQKFVSPSISAQNPTTDEEQAALQELEAYLRSDGATPCEPEVVPLRSENG
jgi:hypothetical protein